MNNEIIIYLCLLNLVICLVLLRFSTKLNFILDDIKLILAILKEDHKDD